MRFGLHWLLNGQSWIIMQHAKTEDARTIDERPVLRLIVSAMDSCKAPTHTMPVLIKHDDKTTALSPYNMKWGELTAAWSLNWPHAFSSIGYGRSPSAAFNELKARWLFDWGALKIDLTVWWQLLMKSGTTWYQYWIWTWLFYKLLIQSTKRLRIISPPYQS